ncbi:ABC transporter permease [Pseudorhodoplanes sp.]|uniref:ABC transporter permease n=1 Tax=Pseudorhodoplanes sp. TaxID=1934341 RepID=UPI002BB7F3DE|nr:ABC transporter permease subunit [Pseudorhodoplanes sp.]HWV55259.1 ABC transporter permease subunit [Pseudorhodoplanes sp.]
MSGAGRRIGWRGLVIPVGFVVIAELAARLTGWESSMLASPSAIVLAFFSALTDGTLAVATLQTLATSLAGLAIGAGLGLLIGILLGLVRTADRLMEFSIEAFRPIPAVALIPIALLIFGFGFRMEIAIVAFAAFWPVLILTRTAVSGVEPRLIQVARALGFGAFARVWKIVLPAALPRIFVAFRLAAGIALIVAVTVEIAANPLGLGYNMMLAQQTLRPELMLALLVWLGVVGWALNHAMLWSQSRLFGPAALVRIDP